MQKLLSSCSLIISNYTAQLSRPYQFKKGVYVKYHNSIISHFLHSYISSAMGIITELPDYQEEVSAVIEKRHPSFK